MARLSSVRNRLFAAVPFVTGLFLVLYISGFGRSAVAAQLKQVQAQGPKIWLADNQPVPLKPLKGGLAKNVAAGQAKPLSMATADVDGDGIADVVAGFSTPSGGMLVIHRGNLDAFAPQSAASLEAIGHSHFPAPFLPEAQTLSISIHPDFMAFGRFTSSGNEDLAVASRGGNTLLILPGDGKGKFGTPQTVALTGRVTSLAAEKLLRRVAFSNLVVGVSSRQGSSLQVFTGSMQGLESPVEFPLTAPATNILFGDFGDSYTDTAFLSDGKVYVLHSSNFQMEEISLPVNASAMALGSFVSDRNSALQIALLTSDGTVHFAAHNEFDPRPLSMEEHQARMHAARRGFANPMNAPRALPANGWQIIESVAAVAPFAQGQPPVFFRTRISDNPADDLMVFNPAMSQLAVITHPRVAAGATNFAPAQIATKPYNGSVVAALPMRTNIDNRPGVVALHQGQLELAVMMPLPDPTFFVNRTDDPTPGTTTATCNNVSSADLSSSCSLREAVLKANATAGTDTITLAAGTYTLSIARQAGDNTGAHGGLYINDSVNIVGAGQAFTIIQGGTSATTGVDLVFAVNEDIQTVTNASASFSNMTIKFGHNRGSVGGTDGDGGCTEFDTGFSGTATLTLTNVTISNCVTQDGNGGGLVVFNASSGSAGTGSATISNSIFQNNSVAEQGAGSAGSGGAIWVADLAHMTMSNSQVINNSATQVNGSGRGTGGGLFIFSAGSGSPQTAIHGSTISGNSASGSGGGIWSSSNLLIDNTGGATTISGNAAGANSGGSQNGGGIYLNTASPDSTTLTKVTITGNTATSNGGGIATGNDTGAGSLTMHFSRLAGNTATVANNLDNDNTVVTATNNWWGTNTPSSTISTRNGGSTTSSPFVQFTHTVSPATIKINQSATLTGDLSKDNTSSGAALAGNLDVLVGVPITFNSATLGSIPQAQPEALNSSAQATATFNAGSTSGTGHASATIDQQTVVANITILEPLQISQSFNPTTVAVNASSTLTFAVTNPNSIATDASFTDTLPAGLVVAATPGVTNTCGGTVTATAGSGSISFSNASLAAGACSISVKVSASTDGTYNNSVTISSTAAGTGALSTSSASLTVITPPSIAKVFGASTVPLNGVTSLTFTITNNNTASTLNGLAFTDSLPSGLVVASTPGLNSTCGGTATAVGGASSVSLSGASLSPGAACALSVNVQGTTAGVKNNSVSITSTNGGTGNTSNASITVVGAPVIGGSFGAGSIPLNGSTSLSFTVQNNNVTTSLTGVAFTDNLPSGLVVATPNGLTGSCGGGTITATAGSSSASLSGATLASNSSCTFSINVTGTTAGAKSNSTGTVNSAEGGSGSASSANINVVAPPSIAIQFNPTAISLNATTSLTFTVTNPSGNPVALTGVSFTNTLPTGLTVANASATICGGTVTTTAPTGISMTGATIAANGQCQFSVTVTGSSAGSYTDNTGNATSTNGGTGNTATANVSVASAPSIATAFGASSIPLNGTTSLTFTLQNPNASMALTGLSFNDNLPAGLVVASTPALSNTCGGTATAVGGASSVSLTGGTLASSASCTVSVNVQGTTAAVKNNSVTVSSTEAGTGNTSNASITVVGPPSFTNSFGAASVPLNGSTSLSFTLQNNNSTTALTGVAFSDTLPAGLVIATPNGLAGSCGTGTVTATVGTNVISLTGGTLAASSSCTFAVNVTGVTAGLQNNTTGNVTSTQGGTGGTASASLVIEAPPSFATAFNPTSISPGATTSLTFTINNPSGNPSSLSGVAFTDTLPTGLTVANASATICGGTVTTTAPTGIAITGATIAANGQCQFSVTVTGASSGSYTNTTGAVTSTNGGTGNSATSNLTVVTNPPALNQSFGSPSIPLNGSTSLSFTVQNNNGGSTTLHGVGFSDVLPAGLVISTPNGLTGTCGGGSVSAIANSGAISLSGATLAANSSCTFSVNVTGTSAGAKNNTTGNVTSTEGGAGGTASGTMNVEAPPAIAIAFNPTAVALNATSSLTFTITNPTANAASLTGVAFTDTLPTGLTVGNASATICGGTVTTTAPTGIAITGATIAANGQCQFSVTVTGTSSGSYTNTTGSVTAINGGTGNSATANLTVAQAPTISTAFTPVSIASSGESTLSFAITNPNAGMGLTGVAFTDSLPAGLAVSSPNGLSGSCGSGTISATAGSSSINLTGGTLAAGASCSLSVNVTPNSGGSKINSVGVSATESGAGNTANATLTVNVPPSVTASFGAASIPLNGTSTLTFVLSNANASTLTNIQFGDRLPAGLTVASPNGLTGNCGANTVFAGLLLDAQVVNVTNVTLPGSGSCTFSVNVVGTGAGTQNMPSNLVNSNEGGIGVVSPAIITVVAPPAMAESFSPALIAPTGVSTLTFTVSNPTANSVAETGVAFTESLPSGLVVANPNGSGGTCTGTTTATPGSNSISFSGGAIAVAGSCTVTVDVTASTSGSYTSTSNPVSSLNGGTGNSASASLTVASADLIVTNTHSGTLTAGETGAIYTMTVANNGQGPTLGPVTVVNTPPALMTVTDMSGAGWTCTLSSLSCTRSDVALPGASYPAISVTVEIDQHIANNFSNTATVSGGGEVNTSNDSAIDTVTLGPPITIAPHATVATSTPGSPASFVFDVAKTDPTLGMITFSCSGLPLGASCVFSPSTTVAPQTVVTMTIETSKNGRTTLASNQPTGKRRPLFYGALAFPVFGLVGIAAIGKRDKKARMRLGILLVGMIAMLAFAGCAGFTGPTTPAGTYQITVTATSATTQVSTPVTLTVTK